jgi:hypothetical protein
MSTSTRRSFLKGASTALAILALGASRAARSAGLPRVTVYRSPACGCCGGWVDHMRASGYTLDVRSMDDVTPMKARLGIPESLWSCHTAVVEGYAIEGHVPATDVTRLLAERPKARGLAVPGMVPGSPGMSGPPQRYRTVVFDERGFRTFQTH